MMNILTYSDGKNSLIKIAEKSNRPIWDTYKILKILEKEKLISVWLMFITIQKIFGLKLLNNTLIFFLILYSAIIFYLFKINNYSGFNSFILLIRFIFL